MFMQIKFLLKRTRERERERDTKIDDRDLFYLGNVKFFINSLINNYSKFIFHSFHSCHSFRGIIVDTNINSREQRVEAEIWDSRQP